LNEELKPPIDTKEVSMIEIPSAVYSLEFHEIYPYDRFAHNILRIGIEALHQKNRPESILVSFLEGATNNQWWVFNARIGNWRSRHGDIHGFRIATTPIAPLLIFGVCHALAPLLFDHNEQEETFAKPDRLRAALLEFGTRFSGALKSSKDQGLASAIRGLYESYGIISVLDIQHSKNRYDACAQFIANHEIAHAYVGQLASTVRQLKAEEYKAFEFIVDLVATQWMYRRLIINTPDSTEYRDLRGTSDHAESILLNGYLMAESQILILLLFAIGSALTNNGRVSLEGGLVHPHSVVRHLMQHVALFHPHVEQLDRESRAGPTQAISPVFQTVYGGVRRCRPLVTQ
jgi:hypothetical protein